MILLPIALGVFVGCSNERSSERMSEQPVQLNLQNKYALSVEVLSTGCAAGAAQPERTSIGDIFSSQDGRSIAWEINSDPTMGTVASPLRMSGRICEDDIGVFLALRGTKVARTAMGSRACRSSLMMPSGLASCSTLDDICADPVAVRLRYDECSQGFTGTFTACVHFSEACRLSSCGIALRWTVTSPVFDDPPKDCTPLSDFDALSGCSLDCASCSCEEVP